MTGCYEAARPSSPEVLRDPPAAAATSASNRCGSLPSSGCHCTPIAKPAGFSSPAADLHRLHGAVRRPRRGHESLAEPVDGLMMVGRHVQPRAPRTQDPAEYPGVTDPDPMAAGAAVEPGMPLVPDHLREVLVQRPAAGDVEQVNSPADSQQWRPGGQRRVQHGQLPASRSGLGMPVSGCAAPRSGPGPRPRHRKRSHRPGRRRWQPPPPGHRLGAAAPAARRCGVPRRRTCAGSAPQAMTSPATGPCRCRW